MAHRFKREELYGLVWSEPMKTLAARYSISDVGLSKACRRYDIPVPERGYWAKRKAGKQLQRRSLPHRGPGMSDNVVVGAGKNWWYRNAPSNQEILQATPTPPAFDQTIEEVTAGVMDQVGYVTIPSLKSRPHRFIGKLLEADEERRKKAATERFVFSWDKPQFDSPFERRRLKLISAIFTALDRCGMRPSVGGREARELFAHINDTNVVFSVDDSNADLNYPYGQYQRPSKPSGKMKIIIKSYQSPDKMRRAWEDTKDQRIEDAITEIVISLIVAGESQLREGAQRHYEWMVERKAQLIEEARHEKEEAERKERERLIKLEAARVDRLIQHAAALRQAQDIRSYVAEVQSLGERTAEPIGKKGFENWRDWALAQADRIDPVKSKTFLESMHDPKL